MKRLLSIALVCVVAYLGYARLVTDWIGFVDDAMED